MTHKYGILSLVHWEVGDEIIVQNSLLRKPSRSEARAWGIDHYLFHVAALREKAGQGGLP